MSFFIVLNPLPKVRDMGFLKQHIEKVIFGVLVLGLGVTLMTLMNLRKNRETVESVRLRVPEQDLDFDPSALEALKATLTTNPPQVEISENAFTPAVRVRCINPQDQSLIPAGISHCPYCGFEQVEADPDTDGDGVPDKIELRLGLNPQDDRDVYASLDGSGFPVRLQHERGHDPMDATDTPPHIDFLRVERIDEQLIRFEFLGFTQLSKDAYLVQLRYRYPDQNDWEQIRVRAGEDTSGQNRNRFGRSNEFTAERFVETGTMVDGRFVDQSYVTITGGRSPFRLFRDGEKSKHSIINRSAVLHLYVGPEWTARVRPDETFTLENTNYTVVDIQADAVVIAEVDSGTQRTIRAASDEEVRAVTAPEPEASPEMENPDILMDDPGMFFQN